MTLRWSGLKKIILPLIMLLFFAAEASYIAIDKSNTWDESAHILSGYAHITEGLDGLSPLNHPAFGRMLAGLGPAAVLDLSFDPAVKPEGAKDSRFFPYSIDFIYKNSSSATLILFLSRAPNILIGVLLGVYVFIWSKELWGENGGLLSLFLYSLCPNILAHASLATTDIPITAFFFISTYYLFRLQRHGTGLRRIFAAAVFMALAFTSKHTAMLLLPVFAASFVLCIKREGLRRAIGHFTLMALLIYGFIWAVYGLRFHSPSPYYLPLDWALFSGSSFEPLFTALRAIKALPEAYLYGIAGVIMGAGGGKSAFFMGMYSATGWWYYFIVAFTLKVPIPVIILGAAALLYGLADRVRRTGIIWLVSPALLVFTVISLQNVNIGLRHVLPAFPFLFTITGLVAGIKTESMRLAKAVFFLCVGWYLWANLSIFPHQLAYFNEIAGGPDNGSAYLVDSNLDWGQDLKGLKTYMDKNGIETINLGYFGLNDPKNFGIRYEYLPSYLILDPVKAKETVRLDGWFAVSATMLQGVYLSDRDYYAVFRDIRPVDTIGHSIYIYRFDRGESRH